MAVSISKASLITKFHKALGLGDLCEYLQSFSETTITLTNTTVTYKFPGVTKTVGYTKHGYDSLLMGNLGSASMAALKYKVNTAMSEVKAVIEKSDSPAQVKDDAEVISELAKQVASPTKGKAKKGKYPLVSAPLGSAVESTSEGSTYYCVGTSDQGNIAMRLKSNTLSIRIESFNEGHLVAELIKNLGLSSTSKKGKAFAWSVHLDVNPNEGVTGGATKESCVLKTYHAVIGHYAHLFTNPKVITTIPQEIYS